MVWNSCGGTIYYVLTSYYIIQQQKCWITSASGLNRSWTFRKQTNKQKTGLYSENSAPSGLNSVLIPLKIKSEIRSRGICNHWGLQMAKLFQTDSWRLRYTGSEVLALVFGCQRRMVPLLHLVGSVCFVLPDDGQRVSLCVEDPVVEW